jgi:hypothetical protein
MRKEVELEEEVELWDLLLSSTPSGGGVVASWGRGGCGSSLYWDLHR